MIISHKHRYVFVEVPHTASHAIAEQLVKHYAGEPILRKHSNLTQFLGQASREEREYFKFATVRNPLDAATTDFAKLKSNHRGQFTNPAMLLEKGGHITKQHLREFRFVSTEGNDFPAFFKTFRNKLYNNWCLVGNQLLDYVIRYETLQEGFAEVLKALGLEQVEPISSVNRTKGKKSYVEYYTPEIFPQVARCYGPFMKKWKYSLPEEWGDLRPPKSKEVQFKILDGGIALAARLAPLNPDSRIIQYGKKVADTVTRYV